MHLSQRKSDKQTTDKELGALLSGVNKNHQLLVENQQFRTPAELAIKRFAADDANPNSIVNKPIRNKGGDYSHTFGRQDLLAELQQLFAAQTRLGNPHVSGSLKAEVEHLLMAQRDALSGDALLKMVGKCTHEFNEYKAAKHTYSAERFIWLGKLNNLRIQDQGREYALTQEQRQSLLDLPYQKAKLTYQQVRKQLVLPETAQFKGLSYNRNNPENAVLMELKAWHKIRNTMEKNGLKTEWQSLATRPDLLDEIGTAFSLYKTDADISDSLKNKLPEHVLSVLLEHLNFSQFIHLSLKALHKILPLMEQGLRYDAACQQIYGHHYGHQSNGYPQLFLPSIVADDIRNPVVVRSLTQARKIINAIIRRYGSPLSVHIETGRELGRSFDDRKKIEQKQKENQKSREQAIADFKQHFPNFVGEPRPKDVLKWRLYKEQNGKCLYSGLPLDVRRLHEDKYAEIDHALPFSRTWDDSFNNKILVSTQENQNKRNQTPYEYLDGENDSERWRLFVANVLASNFSAAKKQRVMLRELDEKKFIQRNLNDSRYVARFLCQFIERNLMFHGNSKKRVFASNGQITNLLRKLWGLHKSREENNRHHALDAIVVACSTIAMQQKITNFTKHQNGNPFSGKRIDLKTGETISLHFPEPWEHFRQEVMIRVFDDNPKQSLIEKLPDRPQAIHEFVSPLFVSRMPRRKMSGQGHMETVKSAKYFAQDKISIIRKTLDTLKLEDLDNMMNREREPDLYHVLKTRLQAHQNDAKKAFAQPFYKQGGQIVKSIRIKTVQKTGVLLHQSTGIADNASIVRTDVFSKAGKFYLVPIYTWQVAKGILPNRAVIKGKDESEWDEMDNSFAFQFSLYPGDLVKLLRKNQDPIFGYYAGIDRANATINIKEHDMDNKKGKNGVHSGLGVKTALSFQKFQIDVLGKDIHECLNETRLPVK